MLRRCIPSLNQSASRADGLPLRTTLLAHRPTTSSTSIPIMRALRFLSASRHATWIRGDDRARLKHMARIWSGIETGPTGLPIMCARQLLRSRGGRVAIRRHRPTHTVRRRSRPRPYNSSSRRPPHLPPSPSLRNRTCTRAGSRRAFCPTTPLRWTPASSGWARTLTRSSATT